MKDMRRVTLGARTGVGAYGFLHVSSVRCLGVLILCFVLSGCAAGPRASGTPADQKFQAVAVDVYQNPESRSAAEKILGVNTDRPVVKYSPVTGKHYSGDLEFDPETGARLEVIKE